MTPADRNKDLRGMRDTSEFLGICRGVLADGHINRSEATFLLDWLHHHPDLASKYPFRGIHTAAMDWINSESNSDSFESELLHSIVSAVGGEAEGNRAGEGQSLPSSADFSYPSSIDRSAEFVITGMFDFGAKEVVSRVLTELGGTVAANVRTSTNYVLVGSRASKDWKASSFGRKLERAAELKHRGHPIAIITEAHWLHLTPAAIPLRDELRGR